jgi:Bifunctional DNA primase/polymerase, N-terminal
MITSLSYDQSVVKQDLQIAEWFVTQGTPLVLGYAHSKGAGFSLEPGWQTSEPSYRTLHRWLNGEGSLLAVITGRVYDVFDFDVQNGGDLAEFLAAYGKTVVVQAVSRTPSGGYHLYVNTLGYRKKPIARGIDYQGKNGIAFIPPSNKLSKHTDKRVPYRWLDYSPGGDDSGADVYSFLASWEGHRPELHKANGSTRSSGRDAFTKKTLRHLRDNGIEENHDDTLKDLVWHLYLWDYSESRAYEIWSEVVDKTVPKAGKRPYEERDFDRHWRGAESKLRHRRESRGRDELVIRSAPGAHRVLRVT